MKAALRAWGMGHNAFAQGLAHRTQDAAIVRAATARPGIVLRRPIGSKGPFKQHPDLPSVPDAPAKKGKRGPTGPGPDPARLRRARAALEEARSKHRKILRSLEAEQAAIERRAAAEDARWQRQRSRLEASLHRASK
jgi:hypothetical protein